MLGVTNLALPMQCGRDTAGRDYILIAMLVGLHILQCGQRWVRRHDCRDEWLPAYHESLTESLCSWSRNSLISAWIAWVVRDLSHWLARRGTRLVVSEELFAPELAADAYLEITYQRVFSYVDWDQLVQVTYQQCATGTPNIFAKNSRFWYTDNLS